MTALVTMCVPGVMPAQVHGDLAKRLSNPVAAMLSVPLTLLYPTRR